MRVELCGTREEAERVFGTNYERSGAADIPERYMLGGRKGAVQYG
jgi:hypothetical protein